MDALKLKVVWDLTDSVRLVSLTSYNELTRDAVFDWSGAPYEILVQKARGEIESAAIARTSKTTPAARATSTATCCPTSMS